MSTRRGSADTQSRPVRLSTTPLTTVCGSTIKYRQAIRGRECWHCTALHCTALHCTSLHFIALHCSAMHRTIPYRTVPHRTVPYCTYVRQRCTDNVLQCLHHCTLCFAGSNLTFSRQLQSTLPRTMELLQLDKLFLFCPMHS